MISKRLVRILNSTPASMQYKIRRAEKFKIYEIILMLGSGYMKVEHARLKLPYLLLLLFLSQRDKQLKIYKICYIYIHMI